jgi:malonate-semialdehyde dehydrogenase (acetylating)/methylmalonate-semialdehyde dehydrogenase
MRIFLVMIGVSSVIAELLKEAGLPDGVFNVVNGDKEAVDVLLTDPRVQAVSFVGSTPIAEYVYSTGSSHGKRVQALGGAKNHMIVMPDADLSAVTSGLMGAAYGSAGERCMAISVAVCVGDETADELVTQLKHEIQNMQVGSGLAEQEPHMGPLVSRAHADKVLQYIDSGVSEGAILVCDGRGFSVADHEQGYFVGPTLFDNVKAGMRIYQEEIFGPVLCIVRTDNYQQALHLINQHEFGNGTSVFTASGEVARHFVNNVQVGMVGVNIPIPVPMAFHSFGGWKRSVFGPLNMHGNDGVRFYTKMKTVTAKWPTGPETGNAFSMPTMK